MAKTYNDLYLDIRQRLRKAGVEAAQLEARELICRAAGKSQEEFFKDSRLYAPRPVEEQLEADVQRRLAGEPVAYIIGQWNFYGLPLTVTPAVLIPRPDTEIIAARAIELAKAAGEHGRVLDLCTGSGCIGLAVAKHAENCRVVLGDLSEDALQPPTHFLGDFNVIVCNPPYIRSGDIPGLDVSVRDYEPLLALDGGADGLAFYRYLAQHWKLALRRQGTLLFEVGYDQAEDVSDLLAQYGYRNITQHKDYNGILRGVEATL